MAIAIYEVINPVLLDLSKNTLLMKCLHDKTQNANEALNNLMWIKSPKNVYVEREILEVGDCSAIISFNNEACDVWDMGKCIVMKKTTSEWWQ